MDWNCIEKVGMTKVDDRWRTSFICIYNWRSIMYNACHVIQVLGPTQKAN